MKSSTQEKTERALLYIAILLLATYPYCCRAGLNPTVAKATHAISTLLPTMHHQSNDHPPKFLIHGWRWHTLSLIRDLKRLRKLAEDISENLGNEIMNKEEVIQLKSASDFVINFNMKALHRIEEKTFFPFLRRKFLSREKTNRTSQSNQPGAEELQQAFSTILMHLDQERNKVYELGLALRKEVNNAYSVTLSNNSPREELQKCSSNNPQKLFFSNISTLLVQLHSSVEDVYQLQQETVVPCIAKRVPLSEQKTLNTQVLQTLGLLESRTHLVGMYDAIQSIPNASIRKRELDTFDDVIPWFPRRMISRWRTSLYEPKVGRLNLY